MKVTFDPAKNSRNIKERGLPFELVEAFEWATALIVEDLRQDYGERRFQALGLIEARLCMVVFTPRAGAVHVISLRKANERESKRYETQTKS